MAEDPLEGALASDALLSAAVRQHDVAKAPAEQRGWHGGAPVGRPVTSNKPRAQLYALWRDVRNLASFMTIAGGWRSATTAARGLVKAPAGQAVAGCRMFKEQQDQVTKVVLKPH